MRKIILLVVLFVNGFVIFYGCKKDKEEVEYDTNTSQDNALAEATFNDVNNMLFEVTEGGILTTYRIPKSGVNTFLNSCATITFHIDSINHNDTAIIDFGTTNCQCGGTICSDARYRRGKIIVAYTGSYRTPQSHITATFDNYYVGKATNQMFKVTGQKQVINQGNNGAGHMHFSISVNGQLTNVNNQTMTWSSTRDREWLTGESTPSWTDDEYVITGEANGTNFEGNSFHMNITSGLHIRLDCAWVTKGVIDLTPTGKPTRTLDFGDGTCDEKADVTVNGVKFPIILR